MSGGKKSVSIDLDSETELSLMHASELSGMSMEQFCLEAVKAKADLTVLLSGSESTVDKEGNARAKDQWLPIFEKWEPANDSDDPTRMMRFVWEVNGEGMVRWGVKNTKEESLKALDRIAALREKLFQGRVSSTDSSDLIREAREERHRDMEANDRT